MISGKRLILLRCLNESIIISDLMKMKKRINKYEVKNIVRELFVKILILTFSSTFVEIWWWRLASMTKKTVLVMNVLGCSNSSNTFGQMASFHISVYWDSTSLLLGSLVCPSSFHILNCTNQHIYKTLLFTLKFYKMLVAYFICELK